MSVTLEDIIEAVEKYLIVDTELKTMLEFSLAIPLARRYYAGSLFGIVVATSGGGKSEILANLLAGGPNLTVRDSITEKTLMSGFQNSEKDEKAAAKLENRIAELNNMEEEATETGRGDLGLSIKEHQELQTKMIKLQDPSETCLVLQLIALGNQTLSIPDLTKNFSDSNCKQIMSQFRIAHDGRFEAQWGNGKKVLAEGHFNCVAGVTPRIDKYASKTADMGERWLYLRCAIPTLADAYRIGEAGTESKDMVKEGFRRQAKALTHQFLDSKNTRFKRPTFTDADRKRMGIMSTLVSRMRTAGAEEYEMATQPEQPGRMSGMLKAICYGLMAVNRETSMTPHIWWIAQRICFSTAPEARRRVVALMLETEEPIDVDDVVNELRITEKYALSILMDMFSVRLVNKVKGGRWKLSGMIMKIIADCDMEELILEERSRFGE